GRPGSPLPCPSASGCSRRGIPGGPNFQERLLRCSAREGSHMASDADRPLSTIVQDIVGNVQGILRSEIRLAKTEIREEANKAARASTLFISGGVLGIYAVGLLLLTLV